MQKLWVVLCVLSATLSFLGAGYVLLWHGQISPGYACIPSLATLFFLAMFRKSKGQRKA